MYEQKIFFFIYEYYKLKKSLFSPTKNNDICLAPQIATIFVIFMVTLYKLELSGITVSPFYLKMCRAYKELWK